MYCYLSAGGTETIAIPHDGDMFRLYGYKWFSSATDANMCITLARVADLEGNVLQVLQQYNLLFNHTFFIVKGYPRIDSFLFES